jgi:hypothetical protein
LDSDQFLFELFLILCVLPVSVLGSTVRYELGSGYSNTLKRRIADEQSRYK